MTKKEQLQEIAKEIDNCRECKIGTTGNMVPGEGNPNAAIVFVGEAPGKQEALTGKPFIGRSGKLLRETIHSIGLSEDDVFITSVGKYLPSRGTPSVSQIAHGRIHVLHQLDIIDPKIVVLLGAVAVQGVLGKRLSVQKFHGTIREKDGRQYFITLHPAAALRFPALRKIFLEDFETLKAALSQLLPN